MADTIKYPDDDEIEYVSGVVEINGNLAYYVKLKNQTKLELYYSKIISQISPQKVIDFFQRRQIIADEKYLEKVNNNIQQKKVENEKIYSNILQPFNDTKKTNPSLNENYKDTCQDDDESIESILGMRLVDDSFHYLVKFKGNNSSIYLPDHKLKKMCPQKLIDYLHVKVIEDLPALNPNS